MKSGKAAEPSGIIIETIIAAGDGVIACLTSLFNHIIYMGRVPNDWHLSYMISLFKGKGEDLSCRNYRAIKLQEQVMKILGHLLNPIMWNMFLSITCSLVSCQVVVPLTQFSYLDSFKKNTCKRRKTSILHLLT